MRNFVLTPRGITPLWNTWFQAYLKPLNLDINSLIDTISSKGRVYNVSSSCVRTFGGKNYYCPALLDYKNYLVTEGDCYIFTGTNQQFITLTTAPEDGDIQSIASGQAVFRKTQPSNITTPYTYNASDYYQFQYGVAAVYSPQSTGSDLEFTYTVNYAPTTFYILPCSLCYRESHDSESCLFNHKLNLFAYYKLALKESTIPFAEKGTPIHYNTAYIDYSTYESIYIEDTLIDNSFYSISYIDPGISSSGFTIIKNGHLLTI